MSVVRETSKLIGERSVASLGVPADDDHDQTQPRVFEHIDAADLNRKLLSHDVPHDEIETLVLCTIGVTRNAIAALTMCSTMAEQYNSLLAVLGQVMAHGVLIGRRLERDGK